MTDVTASRPVSLAILALLLAPALLAATPAAEAEGAAAVTTLGASLPHGVAQASAFWNGEHGFVLGGTGCGSECYAMRHDPRDDVATLLDSRSANLGAQAALAWTGKYAYLFGGSVGDGQYPKILRFEPTTGDLRVMNATLSPARTAASAVWTGERALVFGGFDGTKATDEILEYDPATDSIRVLDARLPTARWWTSATWLQGKAYVFGGYGSEGSGVVSYDPATGEVADVGGVTLVDQRIGMAVVGARDRAYVLGGEINGQSLGDEIMEFDPAAGTLEVLSHRLPEPRAHAAVAWASDVAFVYGGATPTTSASGEVLRFDPRLLGEPTVPPPPPPDLGTVEIRAPDVALWLGEERSGVVTYTNRHTEALHVHIRAIANAPDGWEFVFSGGNLWMQPGETRGMTFVWRAPPAGPLPEVLNATVRFEALSVDGPNARYGHATAGAALHPIEVTMEPSFASLPPMGEAKVRVLFRNRASEPLQLRLAYTETREPPDAHWRYRSRFANLSTPLAPGETREGHFELLTFDNESSYLGLDVKVTKDYLGPVIGTGLVRANVTATPTPPPPPPEDGLRVDLSYDGASPFPVSLGGSATAAFRVSHREKEPLLVRLEGVVEHAPGVSVHLPNRTVALAVGDSSVETFTVTVLANHTAAGSGQPVVRIRAAVDARIGSSELVVPLALLSRNPPEPRPDLNATNVTLEEAAPDQDPPPSLPSPPPTPQEETTSHSDGVVGPPAALAKVTALAGEHPVAAAAAVAGAGLAAAGVVAASRGESTRYLTLAPALGLFTRLKRPDVLGQETRERIHRAVKDEPGINYSALKTRLALQTGVLVHHLRTLERHGFVVSRRDGRLRRFYPVGERVPEPSGMTPTQERILRLLDEGPLPQRALAHRLGVTKQGVNYHVKTLERKGLIVLEQRDGRWLVRRATPPPPERSPLDGYR